MRRSNLVKKIDNQIYFKVFVALLWARSILLEYVVAVMKKLPILSGMADYVIPCVMVIVFLMTFKTVANRLRGADFVFVMSCIVVFVFEYWFFKQNRPYVEMLYTEFVLGCLPFYFVGVALRGDDQGIIKWLYPISCATVTAFIVYTGFLSPMDGSTLRGGDMNSAYNLLPHICLLFYCAMKEFKWRRLILFVIAAITLFMMGSRGPVLCMVLFVLVALTQTIHIRKPYFLIVIILVCGVLILIPDLGDRLIQGGYAIGKQFGLSTRILDKITSGSITVSSGRSIIRQRIRYYLLQSPIVGLGTYGDRYVTKGSYAHNLFLEIYAHFGYLLGTVFSVAFVALIIRGLVYAYKTKDENAKGIALLLLCCCFKLVVSSSYLRDSYLWLMMGYYAALLRENRSTGLLGKPKAPEVKNKSKFVK